VPKHTHQPEPLEVERPRWWTLAIWILIWSAVATVFYHASRGVINYYTTITWTLPFGVGIIGLWGAVVSYPIIKRQPRSDEEVGTVEHPLHVFITTKGRANVLGALTRVIRSTTHFESHFRNYVVHIVTDEGCEAMAEIRALAAQVGAEVEVVPSSYRTARGARFKARASQYSLERLIEYYGGREKIPYNCWTYRLDDDTSVGACTVRKLAAFILQNQDADSKHLAQGILAYRRSNSTSVWMWLADSIRTADDLFRFPLTTGRGTPRAGLHGENLLVRTWAEVQIGWDFPNELVEDSRFGLKFCEMFPGRSAWITARVFGATPVTSWDFVSQRQRWADGMFGLAFDRNIPLRYRWLIMHNMIVWATGITQPVLVVLGISFMVGDFNVAPIFPWLAPLWVLSVGYTYWAYWEGLRQNAYASGMKAPSIAHRLMLIPGIIWFSLLEGAGGTFGSAVRVTRWFRREKEVKEFTGIAKPA
jgi:hypothetical protein